jgi:hypothetical protein
LPQAASLPSESARKVEDFALKTALEKKRQQIEAQLKAIATRDKETARKEDTGGKLSRALSHSNIWTKTRTARLPGLCTIY